MKSKRKQNRNEKMNLISDDDDHFTEGDDIETNFNRAADYLQHLVNKLDSKELLRFYGLFKQATVGRCNVAKPGIFNMQGRAKWTAWNELDGMSKEAAMIAYVNALNEIEPDWNDSSSETSNAKKTGWVSVSRPCIDDDDDIALHPSDKKFIDHVKEGNLDEILSLFGSALGIESAESRVDLIKLLNERDESGLAAIHWAADRGHANILDLLLTHGADVNFVDGDCGQTALHYAVSCGHVDSIRVLLKHGADQSVRDADEMTCSDIAIDANDTDILEILRN